MSGALDSTHSMLGDLGIEEVEPNICADSFDNRAILRTAKLTWAQVYEEDGLPTGMIRAYSHEEKTELRDSVWGHKKHLMKDPENMYSEYLDPGDIALDADIPWWLKQRLRGWISEAVKGVPDAERRPFPIRCEVVRLDGTRCWNWAASPLVSKRCKLHRPWEMEKENRANMIAKMKLIQSGPAMADNLEALALTAAGEAVRLKATTEILDRIGVRGGVELDITAEITTEDPASEVRSRLDRLAKRMAAAEAATAELETAAAPTDVVDAELVEPETQESPND